MQELTDAWGVPVWVHDAAEIVVLEHAFEGVFGMEFDPLPALIACERRAPVSVLTECVVRLTSMEERATAISRALLAGIALHELDGSASEVSHFDACTRWVNQDFEGAHAVWRALLARQPRNILALFGVHMLEFNMGWTERMRETVRLVGPHWSDDLPLYGYIRGIEAFALVENGEYDAAGVAAAVALKINPRDIYAMHAACHVEYECGRYETALNWMEQTRVHWANNLCMRIHLWWHHALFNYYLLDVGAVMRTYHEKIRDKNSPDGYEDLDAVSLLWRLSLIGEDVSEAWQDVAQYWMPTIDQSQYWFNDVHAILAMLASNHHILVQRILRRIDSSYINVPVVAKVTKTVCLGLVAFHRGDYDDAYDLLVNVLPAVRSIGGSNAQRDLLELTTIEAAIRAGRYEQAERLIRTGRSLRHASPLRDLFVGRLGVGHGVAAVELRAC